MNEQARQLVGIIENITYYFGMQCIDEQCCDEKISHGEFRAMQTALRRNICTMQNIAESAAVTKSGATRIAKRLEDKGLAIRQQDQKDGRICCVTLTEEGRALLNGIEDRLINKIRDILAAMDPAMRDILVISLTAFVQAAEQQTNERIKWRESCCGTEASNIPRID
jgi:DNA-binding MarR family transcriptional regulator